ncbi:MAG: DNA polymerase IV [Lewinellaceae bacterium]|nr:DNA polymerase IV [Lewinellaceae bacterium]
MRKIIHIDMDAFYASVEQRDHPELRGKPIAVGSGNKRGVVAAASYEARKFGVRSAMASVTAQRLCPPLIFVKARFEVYRQVSQQIRAIFEEYTDLVEPLSLDEAYLDVTENKKGIPSAMRIAMEIRQKIREQTQLTASAGVSFNKFLAKVASDINKPNGMKVILPEEAEAFLEQLPIQKFHGIGKVTAARMREMGIHTGADLKKWALEDLLREFGKVGDYYYHIVRAEDHREVNPHRVRKSVGAERTFLDDLDDPEEMREKLDYIAGVVFDYLQKKDRYGRTVTLKIKTADYKSHTRSKTFVHDLRDRETIYHTACELLEGSAELRPVRLLGITISNLEDEAPPGGQLEFDFE